MEFAYFHASGSQNTEVAARFLGRLWTPYRRRRCCCCCCCAATAAAAAVVMHPLSK